MQVVAACVSLTALCNAAVLPLCIDVAALTAIDAGATCSEVLFRSFFHAEAAFNWIVAPSCREMLLRSEGQVMG
jgi:hypothetical protein